MSYLLEYISGMDDIYGYYDRRDYLRQSKTSFVLLVTVNRQSYTKSKWLPLEVGIT